MLVLHCSKRLRKDIPFFLEKDKWSIFGGKAEVFDKTTFETAKREFNEESGISFETIKSKSCGKYNFNFPFLPDFFLIGYLITQRFLSCEDFLGSVRYIS